MSPIQDILFERKGDMAVATLNRPKALNALTLEMCLAYDRQLATWAVDDSVRAVILKGAGERAFCAGGDVLAMWRAGKAGEPLAADFFRAEYRMNRRIEIFPKPHIALMDGVTMGGGRRVPRALRFPPPTWRSRRPTWCRKALPFARSRMSIVRACVSRSRPAPLTTSTSPAV